ncbi:MAG: hypothetical protein AAF389_14295 [Gemmatimonadota bacterium]
MRRLLFVLALALVATPIHAQPREWAFGFSGVTYLFEPEDAVYTDPDEHLSGNFGFRLTKASFGDRSFGWMINTELYLGVADRFVIDVDLPNTIFGLQAFAGPVVAFGPFQTYATFGVNRTTVGESKIVTVPGPVVVTYVAGGGISQAWSDIMEARAREANTGGDVLASVPRYHQTKAATMIGMSYDFGGSDLGIRLSFDYIGVFLNPVRNNYRMTFSLAG